MIKDLRKVFNDINSNYSNINYELDTTKTTSESIYFTTNISSHLFKGNALVTGVIENTGLMNVYFTFGEVVDSPKLQGLINEFNMYAAFAKVYIGTIDGKKHLEVRFSNGLELDDNQAIALYNYYFDNLLSDDLVAYLAPMTELAK